MCLIKKVKDLKRNLIYNVSCAIPLLVGARGGSVRRQVSKHMKRKILPYKHYLKPLAKALRKNMTFAEVLLWNELKAKRMCGYDFDRQRPIYNYIVDFYCKDLMLAIEVDGISHYSEEAAEADKIRQGEIEALGVRFLRYDDGEVRNDMQNVIRSIEGWILDWEEANLPGRYPGREPTPNPSKEGS